MSQRQAYKEAFQVDYDDNAIDVNACKLFNETKMQLRYKELLEEIKDVAIMSATERMIWLTEVIKEIQRENVYVRNSEGEDVLLGSKNADLATKMKAMDILNKMSGVYTTKLEGNIGVTYEEALKKVSGNDEY